MFKKYGYYSVPAFDNSLKIININTQSCFTQNIGIISEPNDSGQQLKWLRQELYDSENKNQAVWIIGHIPPSNKDCGQRWAVRFFALVERFQHIIRFQSFGHIHEETFSVTRSLIDNKPIAVEFVAGNAGTYDKMDPTFRLYQMHEKYHVPIDFSIYRVDIEQSNQKEILIMERWFDFKREFQLQDLSPSEHLRLTQSFLISSQIAQRYEDFRWKRSESKLCDY